MTYKVQQFSEKPHILIVDDDARICALVSRYLWDHDFVVLEAANAQQARAHMQAFAFDALIVDVMMPGETGLEFVQALRKTSDIPVLMLTALGEVEDRITGFERGADDYLPKPFEAQELVLRLRALLRRMPKPASRDVGFRFGPWSFDAARDALEGADGALVSLTEMDVKLLKALAAHNGAPVSRDDLAQMCGVDAGGRTIDVQVTRLRRKIEDDTKMPRYLKTVRGQGYLLRVEEA